MNCIPRFLIAVALLAAATAQAQTAPRAEAAWARPTVAGQSAGGGYVRLSGGSTADRLVAASAPVAKAVELHTMEMDGNVMRMRPVDGILVAAGQTVELKPGGLHMMFMGLARPLQAGDSFPLTLRFEKGGEVKVDVKVMTAPAADHKH